MEKKSLSAGMNISSFENKEGKRESFNLLLDPLKPSVLLHACCGPCATSCIERIAFDYNVIIFFYNPNIMDPLEYNLRKEALLKFIKIFNEENKGTTHVNYIEGRYEPIDFIKRADRLKDEPEGGRRCDICFEMRLSETAIRAREIGADYFTTTMSVSPHKDYDNIKHIGLSLESKLGIKFLDIDFKKKNGFGRSVELSKKHGLYRQKFCGCEYARNTEK